MRNFLEAHGESRFTLLGEAVPDVSRTINRAGFRRRLGGAGDDERWEYLILPEAWKGEVCRGLDPKRTAALLAARGLLTGYTSRHPAGLVTIPGEGKRRCYQVAGAILAGEPEEAAPHGAV